MLKRYAFCHPGKNGDALYTLPTIHTICERDGAVADFYTSEICRPIERLMRYQDHINDFIIPPEYKIEGDGQGVQPWRMPVPAGYDQVFQLGFQHFPSGALHLFIARSAGLPTVPNPYYKYPDVTFFDEPYIVLAFNWLRGASLQPIYEEFLEQCPIKVIQVSHDIVSTSNTKHENLSHLNLLEVLSLLAKAQMFIGFYSSPLALANGFPNLIKIITLAYSGGGEQHGLHLPHTYELLRPSSSQLLESLKLLTLNS